MQIVDKNKEDLRNRLEASASTGANEFVRRVVTTIKPRVIVENRSAIGFTLPLAQGLNDNGVGKLIVYAHDTERAALLKKEIAQAGIAQSVSLDIRQGFPLESKLDGAIDLLLCSTDHEQVVRGLLPQINPVGLILLHASEGEHKQVREVALYLVKEGILSVVALPERLRLLMAQKRSGRK